MANKSLGKKFKKALAIVSTAVMTLVTVFSGVTLPVKAAPVNSYPVTINFYDINPVTQEKELRAPSDLPDPVSSKFINYHVVVTLADKNTGAEAGWGFASISDADIKNDGTATANIDRFWRTNSQPANWNDLDGNHYTRKNAWSEINYNTDQYKVSKVRLYYGTRLDAQGYEPLQGICYEDVSKQKDTFDQYKFLGNSVSDTSAIINIAKDQGTDYVIRLDFTPSAGTITNTDNVYVLTTVQHQTGEDTYYFQKITADGNTSTIKIPVSQWMDNNGNPISTDKERYTGNEKNVSVKLIKAKEGENLNMNSALQHTNCTDLNAGDDVVGYKISYNGLDSVFNENEDLRTTHYDVIALTKIEPTADYNFLTVLGNAVNYGVTSNIIDRDNHSETNIATNIYDNEKDENFESDLSGDGDVMVPGTFLVGEIRNGKLHLGAKTPATPIIIVGEGSEDKIQQDSTNVGEIITMPKTDINNVVNGMISHMQTVSADLASRSATITPKMTGNNLIIDTTGIPDGVTIYIDADAKDEKGEYLYLDAIAGTEALHINKLPNQLIVFNFKEVEDVTIGKMLVQFDDSGYHSTITETGNFGCEQNTYADLISRQVVWNLANAKTVNTDTAGGMFLVPRDDAHLTLGKTTCGWGVCAGRTTVGSNGEFHFVYRGLTQNPNVSLTLSKTVEGATPEKEEVFNFGIEKYNDTTKNFVKLQIDDPKNPGEKIDYVVKNSLGTISIPVTEMSKGNNVYRIYEIGKGSSNTGIYDENEQEFFAQFEVKEISAQGTSVRIPGAVTYYKKCDAQGNCSQKIDGNRVFENKLSKNTFTVSKKVTGDKDTSDTAFSIKIKGTEPNMIWTRPIKGKKKVTGIDGQNEIEFNDNGEATITIKDGDEVTIYDLKTNSVLSVTETVPDNYQLLNSTEELTATVTNDKTNPAKVELNNKYTAPMFPVKIHKINSLGNGLAGAVLRILDAQDNIVGTIVSSVAAETVNLPVGSYTLKEITVPSEDYLKANDIKFTIADDGKVTITNGEGSLTGNTISMTDEDAPKVANLIIEKTFTGALTNREKTGGIIFEVEDSAGNKISKGGKTAFTIGEDFTEKNGKYVLEIEGLTVGDTYTVKETLTTIDGYVIEKVTMNNEDVTTTLQKDVTIATGGSTVEVENEYKKATDKLVIEKTFSGALTNREKTGGIIFEVEDSAGNKISKGGKTAFTIGEDFTEKNGKYVLEIEGLTVGDTYTVKETLTTIDGYVIEKVTMNNEDVTTTLQKDVTIATGGSTVEVENEYKKATDKLVIEKTFSGALTNREKTGGIIFEVEDSAGNKISKGGKTAFTIGEDFTEKNGKYVLEIEGLTVGDTYTVKETLTTIDGYVIEKVTMNNEDVTTTLQKDVTIATGGSTVEVENEYKKATDKLVIEKTFSGALTNREKTGGIIFEVEDSAGNKISKGGKTAFTIGEDFTEKNGKYVLEIEGLTVGDTYTVKETLTTIDGYVIEKVTMNNEDVTTTLQKDVTIATGGSTVEVENEYKKATDKLVIEKTFSGALTNREKTGGIIFEVEDSDGNKISKGGKTAFTIGEDFTEKNGKYVLEIEGLTVGDTYTVKETLTTIDGYVIEKVTMNNEDVTTTLQKDVTIATGGSTVEVENEYKKATDKLVIEKTFSGALTNREKTGGIIFEVEDSDGNKISKGGKTAFTIGEDFTEKNGKYVLEIEGLTVGDTYTVKETLTTIDGYVIEKVTMNNEDVTTTLQKDVTIATGGSTVEVENEYKKATDKLVIEKTFSGALTNREKTGGIIFEVEDSDGNKISKGGKTAFTIGEDFTEKNGKYVLEIEGLTVGDTYTVKETLTTIDGYVIEKVTMNNEDVTTTLQKDVTIATGGSTVEVENEYKKATDKLVIEKTFSGALTNREKTGGIIFEVEDSAGNKISKGGKTAFTIGEDFTEKNGKYVLEIEGLTVGDTYTVKETLTTIDGYVIEKVTMNNEDVTTTLQKDVTIATGGSTVEVDNKYKVDTPATDKLVIEKTFSGALTNREKTGGIIFEVEDSDGNKISKGGKTAFTIGEDFTEKNGKYVLEIEGLTVGDTYTVKETLTTIDGYVIEKVTMNNEDVTTTLQKDVTIATGGSTVEVENEYKKATDKLVIEKTFSGALTNREKTGGIIFEVEDSDGNKISKGGKTAFTIGEDFTEKNGKYVLEIEGLTVGDTYTVKETLTTIDGYVIEKVTMNNEDVTTTLQKDVTIATGGSTVEVDNKYKVDTPATDKLVIEKTFSGALTNREKTGGIIFEVEDSDGNKISKGGKTAFTIGEDFTEKNGKYVLEIEGLTVGDTYTVKETLTTIDGYVIEKVTMNNEDVTTTLQKDVTIATGGSTVEVDNKYKVDTPAHTTGSLTLIKAVQGEASTSDFTFYVKGSDGKWYTADGTGHTDKQGVIVSAGSTGVTISGIPLQTYTVSEADATGLGATGWSWDSNNTLANDRDVTINATTPDASTTLTNVYVRDTGTIEITKTISGADAANLGSIVFTISGPADFNNGSALTVDYSEFGSGSKSFTVPTGEYTVSETANGATTTYQLVSTKIDGNDGTSATKTLTSGGTETFAFENTYEVQTPAVGSLVISKTVHFDKNAPDGYADQTFPVTINLGDTSINETYDEVDFVDGEATIEITQNSGKTFNNLPVGTVVTVTEGDVREKFSGFTFDENSSTMTGGGTISYTEAVTVPLDNWYTDNTPAPTGTLTIKKQVTVNGADSTISTLQSVKVTVKKDGEDVWIDENGATFTTPQEITVSADGTEKVISGVPVGTYIVSEVLDANGELPCDGYKFDARNSQTTVSNISITATSTSPSPVIMKNAYKKLAELKLNKVGSVGFAGIGGATLSLYKVGETAVLHVFEWTSSETEVKSFPVEDGSYRIVEDKAPEGYQKSNLDVTFDVENGEIKNVAGKDGDFDTVNKVVVFRNDPIKVYGKLSIKVTEEDTGDSVPGAEIEVTGPENWPGTSSKTKKFTTNSNGKITDENGNEVIDVTPGKYTFKVTKVPTGYKVTTGATGEVTVPANGKGEGEAKIIPKSGLKITVVDEVTNKPVPGSTVEVKFPDGSTKTYTTDSKGEVNDLADDTPTGDYTVTVTKVPDGYTVTVGKEQPAKVTRGNRTDVVSKINTITGGLLITVLDEKTGKPVPGATVEVKKPDGTTETHTTDSNGQVTKYTEKDENGHYKAPIGEYKITVIKVPEGYTVTVGKTESKTTEVGKVVEHIAKINKSESKNPGDDIPAQENTPSVTPSTNQQTSNGQVISLSTKKTVTDSMTSARTGESKVPFFVFGGSMASLLVGAIVYVAITKKKREEEESKPLSLK